MMSQQNSAQKPALVAVLVLAALVLAAGLAWVSLRGGRASEAATPHAASSNTTVQTASTTDGADAHNAHRLPARQWKLGDSFVYQVGSTRQVTVSQSAATPATAHQGG